VVPLLTVGQTLTLAPTGVAHGGWCVSRHEGRVVFIRGTLPGEVVTAAITGVPAHGRFAYADTVTVVHPAPGRTTPPCRYAGQCGGCDLQHVTLPGQREWKAAVIRDHLTRLAGEAPERWERLTVEPVSDDENGLGWRTRVRFAVDADGRAGLHPFHSRAVLPINDCLIAAPGVRAQGVTRRPWPHTGSVLAISSSAGDDIALPDPRRGLAEVRERALDRTWHLDATTFWQVHPGAAALLAAVVCEALRPAAGDRVGDLYAGAGLFAAALAPHVAPGGSIVAVEADPGAVRSARHALADIPGVAVVRSRVGGWAQRARATGDRFDLLVVDPPRTGVGAAVMGDVLALGARALAYVSCDPATLSRDIAAARREGWQLASLRAFDIFPMTHHVECCALLTPG